MGASCSRTAVAESTPDTLRGLGAGYRAVSSAASTVRSSSTSALCKLDYRSFQKRQIGSTFGFSSHPFVGSRGSHGLCSTLKMAEPSHDSRDPRPRREEARRDTRSTSPASANTSREASSPERLHQRRTTAANTTASALRPHPPNPERRRDARERYKGYSFVFATDCYHNEDKIFGRGIVNSVSYIKPLINQHQHDSLPPVKLPYFFTGFTWTDENNESRAVSTLARSSCTACCLPSEGETDTCRCQG